MPSISCVAARAIEMQENDGSLSDFFWSFQPDQASRPKKLDYAAMQSMAESAESKAMSKALKKLGWRFVGPTTCYAFMQ